MFKFVVRCCHSNAVKIYEKLNDNQINELKSHDQMVMWSLQPDPLGLNDHEKFILWHRPQNVFLPPVDIPKKEHNMVKKQHKWLNEFGWKPCGPGTKPYSLVVKNKTHGICCYIATVSRSSQICFFCFVYWHQATFKTFRKFVFCNNWTPLSFKIWFLNIYLVLERLL